MELLKKNDPRRKWRSFKRHAILLFKSFLIASTTTLAWYEVWIRGCHFAEDDKDVIIGAIITTLGVTYGLEVMWIKTSIWDKYQKMVVAVLTKDKRTFLLYRDERMPIVFHLLIGAVSVPLLGMIGAIAYKHVQTGEIVVFVIALIFALVWLVTVQIEDPTKGAWFRERIPQDWFDADIDDFFKLGTKHEETRSKRS